MAENKCPLDKSERITGFTTEELELINESVRSMALALPLLPLPPRLWRVIDSIKKKIKAEVKRRADGKE